MSAITLDVGAAGNALAVRQTVVSAFGIPLDREFTWRSLAALVGEAVHVSEPTRISVDGLSRLGVALPDEAASLRELLRVLRGRFPGLNVLVTLHD